MTAPFAFPTTDYSVRTDEAEALAQVRTDIRVIEERLVAARRSAKRSPKKWEPVVTALEAALAGFRVQFDGLEKTVDGQWAEIRAARTAILNEALTWALSQVGPVETLPDSDRVALRVKDAAGGHDVLIYDQGGRSLEAAFVEAGTIKVTDRFATIYNVDERWSHSSDGPRLEPATVNTWSASKMTAAECLAFATALRVVSLVVAKLNEAFGL